MEFEPTVTESAGIYGRDGKLRREVTVLPTGEFLDPLDLAEDEVLWTILKCGENRVMMPFSMEASQARWMRA